MTWPSHDGGICRRALCKAGQDSHGLPQLTDAEKVELNAMSMEQLLEAGRVFSRGTSCYRGVSWDKKAGRWRARIRLGTHNKELGKFNSEEEAAQAYDRAASAKLGKYVWRSLLLPSAFEDWCRVTAHIFILVTPDRLWAKGCRD